jgi:hypothetical protein
MLNIEGVLNCNLVYNIFMTNIDHTNNSESRSIERTPEHHSHAAIEGQRRMVATTIRDIVGQDRPLAERIAEMRKLPLGKYGIFDVKNLALRLVQADNAGKLLESDRVLAIEYFESLREQIDEKIKRKSHYSWKHFKKHPIKRLIPLTKENTLGSRWSSQQVSMSEAESDLAQFIDRLKNRSKRKTYGQAASEVLSGAVRGGASGYLAEELIGDHSGVLPALGAVWGALAENEDSEKWA